MEGSFSSVIKDGKYERVQEEKAEPESTIKVPISEEKQLIVENLECGDRSSASKPSAQMKQEDERKGK